MFSVFAHTGIDAAMRLIVKQLCNVLARFFVLFLLPVYRLGALLMGRHKAFEGWTQALSLLPGIVGVYFRRGFYRWVLPRCGKDAHIGFGTIFSHPTVMIGQRVYIGAFCCLGDITLEDDVLLGSHVSIANGGRQHGFDRLDVPIREQPGVWPRITIGEDTWIGDRAVVLADVGKHCVIGAGAVVTKPIPDYAIAVGNPARVIRYRNQLDRPFPANRVQPGSHADAARIAEGT